MSVVIKGMTMPYSCNECMMKNVETFHCQGADESVEYCGVGHRYLPYGIPITIHRPEWCPLEECESWITKRRENNG